jgi:hypothetical protein
MYALGAGGHARVQRRTFLSFHRYSFNAQSTLLGYARRTDGQTELLKDQAIRHDSRDVEAPRLVAPRARLASMVRPVVPYGTPYVNSSFSPPPEFIFLIRLYYHLPH